MTTRNPRVLQMLPGGTPHREPWPEEEKFFRSHPDVAGMAAEDDAVVLNPFASLTPQQQDAVLLNEAARVFMRLHGPRPSFEITTEQATRFASYGSLQDIRETIAARILSEDQSAGVPTQEQSDFAGNLRRHMKLPESRDEVEL